MKKHQVFYSHRLRSWIGVCGRCGQIRRAPSFVDIQYRLGAHIRVIHGVGEQ